MMVYVATARQVTFRSFRDKDAAATFIARHVKNVVSVKREYGRIIVRYYATPARAVWSVDAAEKSAKRATYALPLEKWPAQYR